MSLVEFAEKELKLAGLFDETADYDGMLGHAALDIVKVFAEQGHSGYSAQATVAILDRLLRYEPLTPLTDDPDEWMNINGHYGTDVAGDDRGIFQSRRNPEAFSHDGGKTYYLLSDGSHDGHIVTLYYSDQKDSE